MKRRLVIFALMSLAASAPTLAADIESHVAGGNCEFSQVFEENLAATRAERLRVEASAGYLQIEGRPALSEVLVRATACASDQRLLDGIRLRTQERGRVLVVEAIMPESRWSGRGYARLDLDIQVPDSLALEVKDGSGWIRIHDVAATELHDGSGEITIERVNGDLELHDGSGEIHVNGVRGNLLLEDGSGSIDILDVSERVHIESDGSGSLAITRAGEVQIDSDGSGSIDIRNVDGDVLIGNDGSGSIRVQDVGGSLTVEDDGSGGIRYDRVSGRVRLPD